MHIAPGACAENLGRARLFIQRAAAQDCSVVLLPEALPFGWMDPSARERAEEIPTGKACRQLASAARDNKIFVCAGLIEREGERLYNSAVLIDPFGSVILHHRKINELAIAHPLYALGDRLQVVDTTVGRIGLVICADAFAPSQAISCALGMMGCQIILSPCAWAVPPDYDQVRVPYGSLWIDNYSPACKEFRLWIAGCSNVGPIESGAWRGHACIGSSLLMDPLGAVRARGQFGIDAEELITAEVSLAPSFRLAP